MQREEEDKKGRERKCCQNQRRPDVIKLTSQGSPGIQGELNERE